MAKTLEHGFQKLEADDLKSEQIRVSAFANIQKHANRTALRYTGPNPVVKDPSEIVSSEDMEVLRTVQRRIDELNTQSESVSRLARIEGKKRRRNAINAALIDGKTLGNLASPEELEAQMREANEASKRALGPVSLKALPTLRAICAKLSKYAATRARAQADREIADHENDGVDYSPSNLVRAWHQIGENAEAFKDRDHESTGSALYPRAFLRRFKLALEIPELTDEQTWDALDALGIDLEHRGEVGVTRKAKPAPKAKAKAKAKPEPEVEPEIEPEVIEAEDNDPVIGEESLADEPAEGAE